MANIYTGFYKRYNGTDWDTVYFKAPASVISETETKKWLTGEQQRALGLYLISTDFNKSNKLLQLNSSGKVPAAQLPFTIGDYLKLSGGTMTGDLKMGSNSITELRALRWNIGTDIAYETSMGDLTMSSIGGISFKTGPGKDINFNDKKLIGVGDPTSSTDAANKQYVDQLVSMGTSSVEAVKAATTGPISTSGLTKIDEYQLVANDRVLVKNQSTASQNGIYIAKSTAWTKVSADSGIGALVFVEHGTVNNDSTWMVKTENTWLKFSQVDLFTFGYGLTKYGNVVGLAPGEVENKHIATNANIALSKLGQHKMNDTVAWPDMLGPGALSLSVSNNLDAIWSSIKNLRGTSMANANNTETISGAYTLAYTKNRTYVGTAAPSGSNYITGDIYIHHE